MIFQSNIFSKEWKEILKDIEHLKLREIKTIRSVKPNDWSYFQIWKKRQPRCGRTKNLQQILKK